MKLHKLKYLMIIAVGLLLSTRNTIGQIKVWTEQEKITKADPEKRPDQKGNIVRHVFLRMGGMEFYYESFVDPETYRPVSRGKWGDLFFGVRNFGGWGPFSFIKPTVEKEKKKVSVVDSCKLLGVYGLESGARGIGAVVWDIPEFETRFMIKLIMLSGKPEWLYIKLAAEPNCRLTGFSMICYPATTSAGKLKDVWWTDGKEECEQGKTLNISEETYGFSVYNKYEYEEAACFLVVSPEDIANINFSGQAGRRDTSMIISLSPKEGIADARIAIGNMSGRHHKELNKIFFAEQAGKVLTDLENLDWSADILKDFDTEKQHMEIRTLLEAEIIGKEFSDSYANIYKRLKSLEESLKNKKDRTDFEEINYTQALKEYKTICKKIFAESIKHPEVIKSLGDMR